MLQDLGGGLFERPGLIPVPPAKIKKATARVAFFILAGGEGFEPPLAESESAVLPLDDPPLGSLSIWRVDFFANQGVGESSSGITR